jgi:diguanylate cyclase (GGDEF)-like protein
VTDGSSLEAMARPRVLLVCDAALRPLGLERELARAGLQVIEAPNPPGDPPPDAMLLALAGAQDESLRTRLPPASEAPPLVVVFASSDPDAPAAALAAGADDALAAPIHLPELCARIQSRIRDRQAPRRTAHEHEVREALQVLVAEARAVLRPEEIVLALVRRLARAFDLEHCSYVVTSPGADEGRVIAESGTGAEGERLDLARYPEIAEAVRTRKPVAMPDIHGSWSSGAAPTLLVLPVPGETGVPGVLLLRTRESQPVLSPLQLDFAAGLGRVAAQALDALPRSVRNGKPPAATDDALTGCASPTAFDRRLEEEYERARRYSLSFSLVLLDIDALGGLNEQLGREAGDRLLQEVAGNLRRGLRLPDFVSRYGGDEFAVVLPETGPDGAKRSVSRMRERLGEIALATDAPAGRPSFSIGIASYPHPAVTQADDLFALVEAALQRGKAQSGDRVGIAE